MQKLFKSRSTKVGTVGVVAASLTELAQEALKGEGIPPEFITALANADLKYWVLAGVVLVLAKISPDKEDISPKDSYEQERIGGSA
jgi:hypothetical protein